MNASKTQTPPRPRRVLILGSTGSIGTQALEVIDANPELLEVVGIAAAGSQPELLLEQIRRGKLHPSQVAVSDADAAHRISTELNGEVLRDPAELVRTQECDVVLNALVGSMGLASTMAALEADRVLALANKESLVAGGQLVMKTAKPGQIVPVDSEHSAMAQCLRAGRREEVDHFVLTASGGPFRGWTREQMWEVTPEQAAQHPTWSMGQMNTLNSATLINKGLELIEATLLFDLAPEDITVSVHPQSIVHSMVSFVDGATIAQASPPSMKLPISLALNWPNRVKDAQPLCDFREASTWTFEPVDDEAFPAVHLARQAAEQGGMYGAVYNAANEEAAAAFLAGRIKFPQIVDIVGRVMDKAAYAAKSPENIEDVLACEKQARGEANALMDQLEREAK